jgi:hypothetical protein
MPSTRVRPNRLPLHPTPRAPTMTMTMPGSLTLRRHGAPRPIRRIARRATPATALERSPACLARENRVVEAVERTCACAVHKRCVAQKGDVVESEVPNGGVDHAVSGEGHEGADYGAGEDVVPA